MDHQSGAGQSQARKAGRPPSPPTLRPRRQFRDPQTGDSLTRGEYVSWLVQGIIRRWTFLIIITGVTIVIWSTRNTIALTWWNLGASYLALVIESIVGIAMFSQTKRDAVIIRKIEKQEELILRIVDHHGIVIDETGKQ